jgi:hypothetical protein
MDSCAVYNSHLITSPPQEITAIVPTCQCSIMITTIGDLPTNILSQSVLLTSWYKLHVWVPFKCCWSLYCYFNDVDRQPLDPRLNPWLLAPQWQAQRWLLMRSSMDKFRRQSPAHNPPHRKTDSATYIADIYLWLASLWSFMIIS